MSTFSRNISDSKTPEKGIENSVEVSFSNDVPIGFSLIYDRVKSVDINGQAAQQGICVGWRVAKIQGEFLDSTQYVETEKLIKKLSTRKKIKILFHCFQEKIVIFRGKFDKFGATLNKNIVFSIVKNGPFDKEGIKEGWNIVEINDKPLPTARLVESISREINKSKTEGYIKFLFSFRPNIVINKIVRVKIPSEMGGGLISVPLNSATNVDLIKGEVIKKIQAKTGLAYDGSNFCIMTMQKRSRAGTISDSRESKKTQDDDLPPRRQTYFPLQRHSSLLLKLVAQPKSVETDCKEVKVCLPNDMGGGSVSLLVPATASEKEIQEMALTKVKRNRNVNVTGDFKCVKTSKRLRLILQKELGGGFVSVPYSSGSNVAQIIDEAVGKLLMKKKIFHVKGSDFKLVKMRDHGNVKSLTDAVEIQNHGNDFQSLIDSTKSTPLLGLILRDTGISTKYNGKSRQRTPSTGNIKSGDLVEYNTETGWQKGGKVVFCNREGTFTILSRNGNIMYAYPESALRLVTEESKDCAPTILNAESTDKGKIYLNVSSSVDDCIDWLKENKLKKYQNDFINDDIDGQALIKLVKSDIEGIESEDWMKISEEIARIKNTAK